ncbi:hypothetical protein [Sulfolobus sp. S-194]|nr:hypothetical protein [Sulfolobus sp. S-194]
MLKLRFNYFEKVLSLSKSDWLLVDIDISNYNIYTKSKIKASSYDELP